MKNLKKAFRGFTLVEVLIVIIIIGILIAALLPRLTGTQARARDNARLAGVNQIANGIALFINDAGSLTTVGSYCLSTGGQITGTVNSVSTTLLAYMTNIPQDPQGSHSNGGCAGTYNVRIVPGGAAAFVYADLEQTNGANSASGGAATSQTATGFQALLENTTDTNSGFGVLVRG